jgi:hypothetical protein
MFYDPGCPEYPRLQELVDKFAENEKERKQIFERGSFDEKF